MKEVGLGGREGHEDPAGGTASEARPDGGDWGGKASLQRTNSFFREDKWVFRRTNKSQEGLQCLFLQVQVVFPS